MILKNINTSMKNRFFYRPVLLGFFLMTLAFHNPAFGMQDDDDLPTTRRTIVRQVAEKSRKLDTVLLFSEYFIRFTVGAPAAEFFKQARTITSTINAAANITIAIEERDIVAAVEGAVSLSMVAHNIYNAQGSEVNSDNNTQQQEVSGDNNRGSSLRKRGRMECKKEENKAIRQRT